MSTLSKEQIENRIRELVEQEGFSLQQLELENVVPEVVENEIDLKSLFTELGAIRTEFRQMNRTEKNRLDTLKTYFEEEKDSNSQLLENINTLVTNSDNSKQQSILLSLVEIMDFVETFNQALTLISNNNQHRFRSLLKNLFAKEDFDYISNNVGMILKKIDRILEKSGVFPIATDGETFSPLTMVAMEKTNNPMYPNQVVLETIEKGYLLNNKVLRLAKVKVNSTDSVGKIPESTPNS